jgi:hypothetical protein
LIDRDTSTIYRKHVSNKAVVRLVGSRRLESVEAGYGADVADVLPADVADALAVLLGGEDPVHVALREQMPHLRVRERCACGCGTAYFELDPSAAAPAPSGAGTVVAADAQIFTEEGNCAGEVLVFAQAGYLSWLEVCSWSDDVRVTLALARRTLTFRGRTPASSNEHR